jgi:hypothetical protein
MVPQRAIFCPVLRYAILTASAGHLTRLVACRGNSGNDVVEVSGVRLPGLTMDTAVRYQDTCISYLLEMSKDPNEQYNEDIITAATILRFYEQIDGASGSLKHYGLLIYNPLFSPIHRNRLRGISQHCPIHRS